MLRASAEKGTTASDSRCKDHRCYCPNNISHGVRNIFDIFLHTLQRILLEQVTLCPIIMNQFNIN